MLYEEKPSNFIAEIEVAACIIECGKEILLVQRAQDCTNPNTWSEPGGKVDPGEDHESAMIRETFEETGIKIKKGETNFLFTKHFYFLETNISIHFFHLQLNKKPKITLSPSEHQDYIWVIPNEAIKMNLIDDFEDVVKELYPFGVVI